MKSGIVSPVLLSQVPLLTPSRAAWCQGWCQDKAECTLRWVLREVGGRGPPKPGMSAGCGHRDPVQEWGQSSPPEGYQVSLERLPMALNSRLRYFDFFSCRQWGAFGGFWTIHWYDRNCSLKWFSLQLVADGFIHPVSLAEIVSGSLLSWDSKRVPATSSSLYLSEMAAPLSTSSPIRTMLGDHTCVRKTFREDTAHTQFHGLVSRTH